MERLEAWMSHNDARGRICPQPEAWNRLWNMLPERKQLPSGAWRPAVPLILGGWWYSSDQEKRSRLIEHLQWAQQEGALESAIAFLDGLPEKDWYFGEK